MSTIENIKITSELFLNDIRKKSINGYFEKIFNIKISTMLDDYDDYDEIDEVPIKIENRGIMIGFIAETIKTPPQIEYVDLDIRNHPENLQLLTNTDFINLDFSKLELVKKYLTKYHSCIIYFSLYNNRKIDKVIFQDKELRYELSIDDKYSIYRIRICCNEVKSTINMRRYYSFE